MENIKISIITVCYNSGNTIERTIQSVLNQTYKNIEYIIVDGGSKDNTLDVIKKYEKDLCCWISEKDSGIYDAMNKGIERSNGDVIGIINSDDWYDENAVQRAVLNFENSEVDIVHGDVFLMKGIKPVLLVRPSNNLKKIWYKMIFNHPTVFVKRSIYEDLGKFNAEFRIASDYDFLLRCYLNHKKIFYDEKVLAYMSLGGISDRNQERGACEIKTLSIKNGYNVYKAYGWLLLKLVKIRLFQICKFFKLSRLLATKRRMCKNEHLGENKPVPIVHL